MHFRPTDILISYNASNINSYFYIHISLFTLSCISFLGFPGRGEVEGRMPMACSSDNKICYG